MATLYEEILGKASIARGKRLRLETAEALTGRTLNPRIFDYEPQGSRMLVVVDPKITSAGGIEFTEQTSDLMKRGTGFIIAVGPHAGTTQMTAVGNIDVQDCEDLLGLHIMFGAATGKVIKTSVYDDDYGSELLLMNTNDLWLVDTNPRPLQADEEMHQAYMMTKQGQEDAAAAALEKARKEFVEGENAA